MGDRTVTECEWAQPRYWYRCSCLRVIDGDTLEVVIDLGLYTSRRERVRLLNVDAPELRDHGGQEAKQFVIEWMATAAQAVAGKTRNAWPLVIKTYKSDSFGRWLGVIIRASDGAILNEDLITAGYVKMVASYE